MTNREHQPSGFRVLPLRVEQRRLEYRVEPWGWHRRGRVWTPELEELLDGGREVLHRIPVSCVSARGGIRCRP